MEEHDRCPRCGAPWVSEEYRPVDRLVVTCGNGHRFLVGELPPGPGMERYGGITPFDGEGAPG